MLAVDPPRFKPREMPCPETGELVALVDAMRGSSVFGGIILAAYGGLRRGEVVAMKWSDIDLQTGVVKVRRALEQSRFETTVKLPKSGKSRVVVLPMSARSALAAWRIEQDLVREHMGEGWNREGLVCVDPRWGGIGFRRGSDISTARWRSALGSGGLASTRCDGFVSALAGAGVPANAVQSLAGHSSIVTMMGVYSHLASTAHANASDVLEAVIAAARAVPKT